jgi:solute carrier family 13 (sodium-dependent dicarboxylate transporter), member 2/3/5
MSFGVPVIAVFLPLAAWWLARPLAGSPPAVLPELGAWQPAEKRVLAVFGLVALAWITRVEPFGGWTRAVGLPGVNDASIALAGVVALCLVPDGRGGRLLTWQEAERIPWGALVLFAGGIAIATAFQTSGLSEVVAERLAGLRDVPVPLLMLIVAASVTLISEMASNTATAVLLMPILAATGQAVGVDPALFMVPAVLAASCGFMLPVATAPNLIAYGTGLASNRRMLREGAVLDAIGVLVIATVCWLVLG